MRAPSRERASTSRRRSGRPNCGPTLEYRSRGRGEQHPGNRQVGRRVSRAEIAKIDNRRETSFADQQIARVKITVRPKRRARPRRRSDQPPPDVDDPAAIDQPIELSHALVHDIVTIAQRYGSQGVAWCICRGGLMQHAEKPAELGGCRHRIMHGCDVRGLAAQPRHDAPRPWIPAAGPANTNWHGNGQRQAWSELRQPALFLLDQTCRRRASWQTDRQVFA